MPNKPTRVSDISQVICVNYAISVRGSRELQFEITTSSAHVRSVYERTERGGFTAIEV